MKLLRYILIVIATLVSLNGVLIAQIAETDSLHFIGKVYDADSLTSIPYVHYTMNNRGSVVDEHGSFSIWAQKGDTLLFSHVSHKDAIWIIPDSILDPDLIVGIFLSKDTVLVNEIIVFPRLPDLKSMALQPTEMEKNLRNAKNNLNIAAYQAGQTPQTSWDAEMNTKYTLDKYKTQATYKGLIPPDEILPITAVLPLAVALIKQKYENDNKEDLKLKSNEEDLIISLYKNRKPEK